MAIVMYVIGGLVVLMGGTIFFQNQKPKIDLGIKSGKFSEIPTSPNCVSSQTDQTEKKVAALTFKGGLVETKTAMKKAMQAYGSIEIKEETDTYIYAVATTGKMKYHDDIELYFDEVNALIQYRSASRAGYSDMGLNRERYDAIAKSYNKQ